ncbi:MAG: hypothetical protein RIM99_19155 [Cyclobacteriaceae bacterium]
MSYFDYVYKKLFSARSASAVLVEEVIKRRKSFLKRFNSWKTSEICQEYLNEIWQSYFWSKKGIDKNPQVLLLETSQSNGFAISYESRLNKYHFHYLFDYLADQVKKLDYRLVTSKMTVLEKGEDVETTELHYLKPKNDFTTPRDQKYGNVQIEYTSINNQPTLIKLIANTYSDRGYKAPDSFEQLARHIFSSES